MKKIHHHLCPGQKVCEEEHTGGRKGTDACALACSGSPEATVLQEPQGEWEQRAVVPLSQVSCVFVRGTVPGARDRHGSHKCATLSELLHRKAECCLQD